MTVHPLSAPPGSAGFRFLADISDILASVAGEAPLRDDGRLVLPYSLLKAGLDATVVRRLEQSGVLGKDDIRRVIADRTLERRISQKEPLRLDEADGILRLIRVLSHAVRVFEDPELAEEWLRCPNPALNDEVPMAMAGTDLGAREVEAVLTRIEHGLFD
jgi:putative toxin-antitoxin system antitoxin component (TIGR02293 family)